MRVLLVDNNTEFQTNIRGLLSDYDVDTIHFRSLSTLSKKALREYDLIVLSGGTGPTVKRNHHQYGLEVDIILHSKTPIIGICLGAQLIAHTYGARLTKLPKRVKGIVKIFGVRQNPFNYFYHGERVFASHEWRITDLPHELECLAASGDGVEMFRHVKKPIYGLQFHPERRLERNSGPRIFRQIVSELIG